MNETTTTETATPEVVDRYGNGWASFVEAIKRPTNLTKVAARFEQTVRQVKARNRETFISNDMTPQQFDLLGKAIKLIAAWGDSESYNHYLARFTRLTERCGISIKVDVADSIRETKKDRRQELYGAGIPVLTIAKGDTDELDRYIDWLLDL